MYGLSACSLRRMRRIFSFPRDWVVFVTDQMTLLIRQGMKDLPCYSAKTCMFASLSAPPHGGPGLHPPVLVNETILTRAWALINNLSPPQYGIDVASFLSRRGFIQHSRRSSICVKLFQLATSRTFRDRRAVSYYEVQSIVRYYLLYCGTAHWR